METLTQLKASLQVKDLVVLKLDVHQAKLQAAQFALAIYLAALGSEHFWILRPWH